MAPKRSRKGVTETSISTEVPARSPLHARLYRDLAEKLFAELATGKYKVGAKLPAERELCAMYNVSRPTVREALIALEVQGLIEVRVGSGAHVVRAPSADDSPGFNVTAFEVTEARLLFEGDAAALAASVITPAALDQLDLLVRKIADENKTKGSKENADREFHLLIAESTGNAAIARTIAELWRLRNTSPECALLYEKARSANVKPVVEEHRLIVEALRSRDPAKAKAAMRAHLTAVLDTLLFATEQQAIAKARKLTESTRARLRLLPPS
jgi:GntR family transcriptional regulator, hexuronate regulon transcriptional repressor